MEDELRQIQNLFWFLISQEMENLLLEKAVSHSLLFSRVLLEASVSVSYGVFYSILVARTSVLVVSRRKELEWNNF